jgi:succinate dehydrogenase/fumarate reductase-like Fe-S protein
MQINGKTARACETLVSPGDEVTLRPLPNRPIIRDLVVDFGRPHRTNGDEVTVTRGAFLRMGRS